MLFSLRDSVCLASGDHNEDRIGHQAHAAWVIDGATDVLEQQLLPGPTDAAWFAEQLNNALTQHAPSRSRSLFDLIDTVTTDLAKRFEAAAHRPLKFDHERPSAAGIVARISPSGSLEAISLGDCSLIALGNPTAPRDLFRQGDARGADEAVRAAVQSLLGKKTAQNAQNDQNLHEELLPFLRTLRDRMNQEHGYGIFSIIPPRKHQVRHVTQDIQVGDRFLLASDGFMRLVDIFEAYSLQSLADAITTRGVASLAVELREIEHADRDGARHPRSKTHDDASALLVEITQ